VGGGTRQEWLRKEATSFTRTESPDGQIEGLSSQQISCKKKKDKTDWSTKNHLTWEGQSGKQQKSRRGPYFFSQEQPTSARFTYRLKREHKKGSPGLETRQKKEKNFGLVDKKRGPTRH